MYRISRILLAMAAFAGLLAAPLHALTVEEMKAMEAKVKQVVSKNMPAVVGLMGDRVMGAGSGVVVSEDGLILTAAHVSKGNNVMKVIFPINGKEYSGKVLGENFTRDVSLIKIQEPGKFPFVEIGDSEKLDTATIVVALGHPGGYDPRRTPPVRIGSISDKNMGGFLVSDCTLVSGDSGGPLFDLDGKVVGIHSSISQSLDFNRDAPVSAAKADWARMVSGESWGLMQGFANNRRGGRGDSTSPSPNRATLGGDFFKRASVKGGVRIDNVEKKSPLEAAGLQTGDVLLKLGKRVVTSADELTDTLNDVRAGEKFEVVYQRDSVDRKAELTLISRAEMDKLLGVTPSPASSPRERRNGR